MLSSSRSLLAARTLAAALLLSGLVCAALVSGEPPKKPPRTEDEEDAPKPTKVIKVGEEKPTPPPAVREPAETPEVDLVIAKGKAKNEAIRKLFEELAVPHDEFYFSARIDRVQPVPEYIGSEVKAFKGPLHLIPIAPGDKAYNPSLATINNVRHYERIASDEVRAFLNKHYERRASGDKELLSRHEQLVAAEQALAWVLRNHQSLRTAKKRVGDAWETLESDLAKFLLEVREQQLRDLGDAGEWDAAFALTRRLVEMYTAPEECAKIAQPLEDILKKAMVSADPGDARMREVRRRLRKVVDQSPDNAIVRPIRDSLRGQAQALFDEAKRLAKDPKETRRALSFVEQAQEAFPELPGLREYRIGLKTSHPILRVGVRELPKFLSPALATTDDELRACELLYEGLVKMSPDASGTMRYHSGLAEGRPRVVPMGRQFQLPRGIKWSDGVTILEAADIRFTLRELTDGAQLGGPPAWAELLEKDVIVGADPYQVTLSLRQGFLDSLAPMTFKIVPRISATKGENEDYDKKVLITSGPFAYSKKMTDDGRDFILFVANPIYGTRPGKSGLPHMQEVRFYVSTDPVKDLESGKVHLALDLRAEEAAALKKGGRVDVVSTKPPAPANRRVYFLALNHRKPFLANGDVRRAMLYGIDREKVLDDAFRGPMGREIHKAINGPFPAHSWACSPRVSKGKGVDASLDLYDLDKAKAFAAQVKIASLLPGKPVTLKYAEDDPALDKLDPATKKPLAMVKLKEQIKAATGIDLELVPLSSKILREHVEVTDFDLAYYHYDYPDETYWLWPLLGPGRTGAEGNYLGFKNGEVEAAMRDAMGHRDFGKVKGYMHILHDVVAREVPIVPLWQLDPLLAWSKVVHPPASFDPLLVFTDADQWHVDAGD